MWTSVAPGGRDPQSLWNGGRPGLCRLVMGGRDAGGGREKRECFLSRNYTEVRQRRLTLVTVLGFSA